MNLFSLGGWSWFWEIINFLFLVLCSWVYSLINFLYQVFDAVARVNLFSRDVFDKLTSRMYIVIAIAMLFIFAYNIILMIINPDDKKSTGATTKLVKETVISFVFIILMPTIFDYMYRFQNNILDSQIIAKVILGDVDSPSSGNCEEGDFDCTCDFSGYGLEVYITDDDWFFDDYRSVENDIKRKCEDYKNVLPRIRGAYSIPPILLSSFYRPKHFTYDTCVKYLQGDRSLITDTESQKVCTNYFYDVNVSRYSGDIGAFVDDTYLRQIVSDSDYDIMEFNGLWALLAGALAVWMFLCYAMEIGVRVAKLGVLQIISPIPVMLRIIPKQKEAVYDKWFKQLLNTYLDVFIRLAIIYFALFAVSLVPSVLDTLWNELGSIGQGSNWVVKALSSVIVILGILKFAQDAPGLFKEFFGGMGGGNFSLRSPAKQLKDNKLAGSALGMAGGAAAGFAGGFFNAGRDIKGKSGWRKAGAITKAPFTPIANGVGGALRGAKKGYGATGFKDLGNKIAEAKYDTDAAHARGVGGAIKHTAKKIGGGFSAFGEFITGSGANDFRLKAIEASTTDLKAVNATFKNGKIDGYSDSYSKMNADYLQGKSINFNGHQYKKTGNNWVGDDGTTYTNEEMGKGIKQYFDDLKRAEFVKQYADNSQAFDRLVNKMVTTLNDNLPKIGTQMSQKLVDELHQKDASFVGISSADQITDKISELMRDLHDESKIAHHDEYRRQIYDLNETLEKHLGAAQKDQLVAKKQESKKG